MIVVDERGEIVLNHDCSGDVLNWDAHVFVLRHWSVQVEVFDVDGEEAGARSGDDAVEQALDDGEVGGGSGHVAGVVEFVTADGEPDAAFFGRVRFEFCDNSQVGGNAVGWFVGVADESHGFRPGVGVWETALGESADLKGRSVLPGGGVRTSKEGWIFEGCTGGRVNNGEVHRWRGRGKGG